MASKSYMSEHYGEGQDPNQGRLFTNKRMSSLGSDSPPETPVSNPRQFSGQIPGQMKFSFRQQRQRAQGGTAKAPQEYSVEANPGEKAVGTENMPEPASEYTPRHRLGHISVPTPPSAGPSPSGPVSTGAVEPATRKAFNFRQDETHVDDLPNNTLKTPKPTNAPKLGVAGTAMNSVNPRQMNELDKRKGSPSPKPGRWDSPSERYADMARMALHGDVRPVVGALLGVHRTSERYGNFKSSGHDIFRALGDRVGEARSKLGGMGKASAASKNPAAHMASGPKHSSGKMSWNPMRGKPQHSMGLAHSSGEVTNEGTPGYKPKHSK